MSWRRAMEESRTSNISATLSSLWSSNGAESEQSYFSLSKKERIVGFFLCLGMGLLCFGLALALTPMILVKSRKFAALFTLGSVFSLGSFSFLWGPWAHLRHLFSRERIPFTAVYAGTIVATLYCALAMHSTVLTLLFAVAQMAALVWFLISYIPGGTTGLTFMFKLASSLCTRTLSQTIEA